MRFSATLSTRIKSAFMAPMLKKTAYKTGNPPPHSYSNCVQTNNNTSP